MTEQQIEDAARRLCAIRGLNPDHKVLDEQGWWQTLWLILSIELRAHIEREQALREVVMVPPKPEASVFKCPVCRDLGYIVHESPNGNVGVSSCKCHNEDDHAAR